MERASSRSCQQEEEWSAYDGYKVEGEEKDEFDDLAEREGSIDGGLHRGFAQHLDSVRGITMEDPRGGDQIYSAFADEGCLER